MDFFDLVNHLFNFFLPAMGVAAALFILLKLPFFNRLVTRFEKPWYLPIVRNAAVGSVVLVVGLLVFGSDGKMITYMALVMAVAVCQWWYAGR